MERVHPLRKWRKENDVTAAALGERVGVVASQITQIESEKRDPSLGLVKRLSAETGIPVQVLIETRPQAVE